MHAHDHEQASMSNGPEDSIRPVRQSPFSILFLFYLVTLGGILSACLRTLVTNEMATSQALERILVVGVVIGCIAGGGLGLFRFRSWTMMGVGMVVGLIVGAVAGGLALVDGAVFNEIAVIAFGGCWLLVVVMLTACRWHRVSGFA